MEEYTIVLESQLGPREGTLQLEGGKKEAVSGWITLVGEKNAVQGRWIGAHLLQLFHHLRTQVSDLECVSVLKLEGDTLSGTLQNGKNTMLWHGEKITAGKGGEQTNAGK